MTSKPAKWVTFHWHIMRGVSDLQIHADKDAATEFFRQNYRTYFQLGYKTTIELPMSFGYAHRQFIGLSMKDFRKYYDVSGKLLKAIMNSRRKTPRSQKY